MGRMAEKNDLIWYHKIVFFFQISSTFLHIFKRNFVPICGTTKPMLSKNSEIFTSNVQFLECPVQPVSALSYRQLYNYWQSNYLCQ